MLLSRISAIYLPEFPSAGHGDGEGLRPTGLALGGATNGSPPREISGNPYPHPRLGPFRYQGHGNYRGIRGARRHLVHMQQPLGTAVRERGFTGRVLLNADSIIVLQWWPGPEPWARNGSSIVPYRPHGRQADIHDTRALHGAASTQCASMRLSCWGVGTPFALSCHWRYHSIAETKFTLLVAVSLTA
jgi:hypothetical protein